MARDRQRAKQRRAERREARLSERGVSSGNGADAVEASHGGHRSGGDGSPSGEEAGMIAAGAPPETVGRSDTVVSSSTAEPPLAADRGDAARGRGGTARPEDEVAAVPAVEAEKGRNRIVAFLFASWAELQRVQWPTRTQLTSMTGIVLGFVVLAGGYLGLLDAIFSRLVRLIL